MGEGEQRTIRAEGKETWKNKNSCTGFTQNKNIQLLQTSGGVGKNCANKISSPPITILSVCLSSYDRMHAGSWKNRLNGCLFCLFVCLFVFFLGGGVEILVSGRIFPNY